jgi:hypothetical protein
MVERKAEPAVNVGLDCVLLRTVVRYRKPGFGGRKLRRRAMLVGGADEQHVVADLAPVAGMNVGRQQRSGEVAEVLDAVDIGKRAGDQRLLDVFHGRAPEIRVLGNRQ